MQTEPHQSCEKETIIQEKIRILHVDDDPTILTTTKLILESDGKFQVENASTVEEANQKLNAQPFDAIVSDYEMPQKNGLQFLEEIRRQKNEIAFVIFTGRGREEVAVKALNLGADRYINKLGDPEAVYCELGYALCKIVERKKAQATIIEDVKKISSLNEKIRVVGSLTRHDVRNKLAGLNNHLFLLKKKLKDDPDTADHIKGIEMVSKQIVELLEFARIYEKLGAEELKYIDVESAITQAIELADLKEKQVINHCQGLIVLSDSLLRQLLYNLIDNTLEHGQNSSQICFRYETGEGTVKLIYEDNGIGIAGEHKKDLFKETNCAGMGHGLYLVARICETYGWSITEMGKQGEGVQFIIQIPKEAAKIHNTPN